MNTKTVCCFLIMLVLAMGLNCKPANVVSQAEVAADKILFLSYELRKDTISNKISANLIQQIIAEGQLKDEEKVESVKENYLHVLFLNNDDKVVDQKIIPHPFIKKLEGIGNSNTLERVEVKQNIAEVAFRINLKPSVINVLLQFVDEKGARKDILKHQLNN